MSAHIYPRPFFPPQFLHLFKPPRKALRKKRLGTIFESGERVPQHQTFQDDHVERRSEHRGGERILVKFADRDGGIERQGILLNDSHDGAFIETDRPLPLLTKIRVDGPGFTCQAVICRIHWLSPEERATRTGGIAIRLLSRKDHDPGQT